MYLKRDDLFVVQDSNDDQVKSYSGQQFGEDIREFLKEGVQVWIQASPPPTEGSPEFATEKDLWFDLSVHAFFVAGKNDAGELTWFVVNPADHKEISKVQTQVEYFPPHDAEDEDVWVHPATSVRYYYRALNNQWCDATGAGEAEFVHIVGDTMTGNLELPQLIVTGDDTVEALIEINEGIITADDSVAGEEQRLYFNGDTIAKHEDIITITNRLINNDQHIENITPYTFRGLQQFDVGQGSGKYVLYDTNDNATDTITSAEKVYLSNSDLTSQVLDPDAVNNGMYLEVQAIEGTNRIVGKIVEQTTATGGTIFTLDEIRANGVSVADEVSHVRIFSVADSSAKSGVYYQPDAPGGDEILKPGQLWVDSNTNIQYIWTGEEWTEVGAACGSGGGGAEIPVGVIWPYAGNIDNTTPLPRGWLLCDGSDIDARYTKLRAIMGSKTPNLKGRYLGGYGDKGLTTLRGNYNDYTRRPRTNSALFNVGVDSTNLGSHKHDSGNISATTNSDGNHTHSFQTDGYNKTGNTNALRPLNENHNFTSNSSYGSHNHSISVSGYTANANLGNHTHDVNVTLSSSWDSYTRPYTYAVHWIIKHD